jgi:hypothetical protein
MNSRSCGIALIAAVPLLSSVAFAAQTVSIANLTRNGDAVSSPVFVVGGDVIRFDASLTVNGAGVNPPGAIGLGLCLEYQQTVVNDPAVANLLVSDLFADGTPSALSGCTSGGSALVPGADSMVVKGWVNLGGGGWPSAALPVKLYDAQFTLPSTPVGSTRIGFGASSTAGGDAFTAGDPVVVCGKPTVSVIKSQGSAEQGQVPARFEVVLSAAVPAECGDGSASFPVTLTLGGGAAPTSGYTISGTDVSWPGGASTEVTINFPADGAATTRSVEVTPGYALAGDEAVVLTLQSGAGYMVDAKSSATMAPIDNRPVLPVPTMSRWGVLLLGLLLVAVAGFAARRHRA